MRTGLAQLPLHGGKAPRWLFGRMVRLAREVVCHSVAEHGTREVLPTGDRKGQRAMTINGPWRICFRFRDGDAYDVENNDYHKR